MNSLESQIQEARLRAELFTKSLQEARLQENISLKALEEERSRWAKSFEEKNTLIDQLERELTVTVDALHALPRSRTEIAPHQTQPFPQNSIGTTVGPNLVAFHGIEESSFVKTPPTSSLPMPPPLPAEHGLQLPPAAPREHDDLRALIARLQEENMSLSQQVEKQKYDNQLKKHKTEQLEGEIRKLEEEKRLQLIAIRDFDGKLQFRMKQVLEYEQQKVKSEEQEMYLRSHVAVLESTIESKSAEVTALESQLSRCKQQSSELEESRLSSTEVESLTKQITFVESLNAELQHNLDVQERTYLSQIASLKELSEKQQQRLEDSERKCGELSARLVLAEKATRKAEKENSKTRKEFENYLSRGREMTASVAGRIAATNMKKFREARAEEQPGSDAVSSSDESTDKYLNNTASQRTIIEVKPSEVSADLEQLGSEFNQRVSDLRLKLSQRESGLPPATASTSPVNSSSAAADVATSSERQLSSPTLRGSKQFEIASVAAPEAPLRQNISIAANQSSQSVEAKRSNQDIPKGSKISSKSKKVRSHSSDPKIVVNAPKPNKATDWKPNQKQVVSRSISPAPALIASRKVSASTPIVVTPSSNSSSAARLKQLSLNSTSHTSFSRASKSSQPSPAAKAAVKGYHSEAHLGKAIKPSNLIEAKVIEKENSKSKVIKIPQAKISNQSFVSDTDDVSLGSNDAFLNHSVPKLSSAPLSRTVKPVKSANTPNNSRSDARGNGKVPAGSSIQPASSLGKPRASSAPPRRARGL